MKTTLLFITTLSVMTLSSCRPSAEEKAATEKAKMDSIAKATELATKQKIKMKLALQDSIETATAEKEFMETLLTDTKGELASAKDKMGSINKFHFGRTRSEREAQIKNQTMLIDNLEKQITNLEKSITQTEEKIKRFETEIKNYE